MCMSDDLEERISTLELAIQGTVNALETITIILGELEEITD